MNNTSQPDWNPTAPEVLRDQRAAYDEMRRPYPVAYPASGFATLPLPGW